jgi:hypothetical protein
MNKSQNINMGNKRRQGNITPQKANTHTVENVVNCEEDESSFAEIRRTITKMFKELKED